MMFEVGLREPQSSAPSMLDQAVCCMRRGYVCWRCMSG